jgi:hypothetical protein
MNHLDEWLHLIANQLKSEAERVGAQARSELYEDAACDTFVRVALEPFLPRSFAIGSGKVIDAAGKISEAQDIIIYRSDYPQFNMPGRHNVFIYESVLATIQVRSKLILKSFFSAMDQCASLGTLNPVIETATRRAMAAKMKMKMATNQQYIHPDPLHTGRFDLIARPPSFIYGFTGYQSSEKQLAENLSKWIDNYHQDQNLDALQLKSMPSVIATQGCFAWRNNAPFPIKSRALMGVGNDSAPLRLIILQILHALNRRLQNTSDGYGIKSTIAPYLAHFQPPRMIETVGTAVNPGDNKPAPVHKPITQPDVHKSQPALADKIKATVENRITETPVHSTAPEPAVTDQPVKTTPQQPLPDNRTTAKPTNPLSLFDSHEPEEVVEEYKFEPIEPAMPEPETTEQGTEQTPGSGQDPFLATQLIDNTKSGQDYSAETEAVGKPQSLPNQLPGQVKAEEPDDPFMDTLVETPEAMEKIKSEPAVKKSAYVTETLI